MSHSDTDVDPCNRCHLSKDPPHLHRERWSGYTRLLYSPAVGNQAHIDHRGRYRQQGYHSDPRNHRFAPHHSLLRQNSRWSSQGKRPYFGHTVWFLHIADRPNSRVRNRTARSQRYKQVSVTRIRDIIARIDASTSSANTSCSAIVIHLADPSGSHKPVASSQTSVTSQDRSFMQAAT